jgi:hypothetical protein
MEFVYLMINGDEWEDVVIFLDKNEAIEASIRHPNVRVEVFSKNFDIGYSPIYEYYKNGKYYETPDD